jgi:uncharacterized protein YggE
MKPIHILGAVILTAVSSNLVPAALADSTVKPWSITVIGTGRVKAKPDEAALQMGVVTQGKTASEALAANNRAMAALMATLNEHGIQERDVQTANFNVFPDYRRDAPPRPYTETTSTDTAMAATATIVSYRVSNEVRVRVRKTADFGKLLDAVVKSGANNINGISFTFSNPEELLTEARAKAIADAKKKATEYATAAGTTLGKVLYIDEQANQNQPYPVPNAGFVGMTMRGGDTVSIASGEQEVATSVTVTYAIP